MLYDDIARAIFFNSNYGKFAVIKNTGFIDRYIFIDRYMILLKQLLKEMASGPKAIIMAGGASVGKSTLLKSLGNSLQNFEIINADKYVEDKTSQMYNNLSAASSQIKKKDLPDAINAKRNFVYDTTAGSLKTTLPLIEELKKNDYDIMMVMVYAHPIVSFIRNFKRERKLPAAAVLSTWASVYSIMDEYKNIFGNNFVAVKMENSADEQVEIEKFEKHRIDGTLQEYLSQLISSQKLFSSFLKKDDIPKTPEEIEKKKKEREKTRQILNQSIEKVSSMFEKIESSSEMKDIQTAVNKIKQFVT